MATLLSAHVAVQPQLARLVRDCWAHDPAFRPTVPVIIARLRAIKRRHKDTVSSKQEEDELTVRHFLRSIHDLIWLAASSDWDQETALTLVGSNVIVTAADETIREVLSSEKGLDCIKSLGWMMFGGLEDGAEIIPEPLLDEHIVCDIDKMSGLIIFNFAVKPPAKKIQWRQGDTKEFDALALALAEMEKGLEKQVGHRW